MHIASYSIDEEGIARLVLVADNVFPPTGSKVLVKINHISPPTPAEKGLVTHLAFVEVILDLLKEVGADITVGDDIEYSSGDGFRIRRNVNFDLLEILTSEMIRA